MNDILQTFQAAVDAYNKYDWDQLVTFFDRYVVLKLPDDCKPPIFGPYDVITYLSEEATDKPTFTPVRNAAAPIRTHDVDDVVGYITHVGTWIDSNHKERAIRYSFAFINRGDTDNPDWKILLLWSSN